METLQKEMQTKMTEAGQKNQDAGAAFLAENEKKPGVQKTGERPPVRDPQGGHRTEAGGHRPG